MKLIQSLLGRRQFLIAAGLSSTSALAYKKLAGAFTPLFQTSSATAAEKSGAAYANSSGKSYPNILSPLRIRKVVVKNRLVYPLAQPHYLQGPENYPADVLRAFYANNARSAGIVTVRMQTSGGSRKERILDSAHMISYDLEDPAVHNYIGQMVEGIHSMGSLVVSPGNPTGRTINDIVDSAKKIEDKGYDVVYMQSGGGPGGAQGGQNSADSFMRQAEAIKNSTNLIIISTFRRMGMPSESSTESAESIVAEAKKLEGVVDILRIGKGSAIIYNAYTRKGSPDTMAISQAIKDAGLKILTLVGGGFGDPDIMEEAIADNKCDMIYLGRQLHSDPDYGRKIIEGRADDRVPCILCNKCHGNTWTGPWVTVCSVNPRFGNEVAFKTIEGPTAPKKVAVIGGGPAGMKAAITAAERGHSVTLYERTGGLGGLQQHVDYTPFKWPHQDYKKYLIHQVNKKDIDLRLNSAPTPAMIKAEGYDVVLVALGAEPVIPKIPGADGRKVFDIMTAHSNHKSLGKNVVFVGAGEYVVEAVIWLVRAGHNVTVVTADKELLRQNRVHYPDELQNITDTLENFTYILDAVTTRITDDKVFYRDAKGSEKSVQADSVVIFGGLKPRTDEAMKFSGTAKSAFFMIGDCTGRCGDLQKSTRDAFFTAYQI